MRLAAQITGEGEPALLVHGFPDSRAVWREQVGPLAEAGFRVIAPDLRGFGESERPAGVDAYRPTCTRATSSSRARCRRSPRPRSASGAPASAT